MRVGPTTSFAVHALAVHSSQMTCRVAGHRSSPTTQPVPPPGAITDDTCTRQASQHTFDIRV